MAHRLLIQVASWAVTKSASMLHIPVVVIDAIHVWVASIVKLAGLISSMRTQLSCVLRSQSPEHETRLSHGGLGENTWSHKETLRSHAVRGLIMVRKSNSLDEKFQAELVSSKFLIMRVRDSR